MKQSSAAGNPGPFVLQGMVQMPSENNGRGDLCGR